MSCSPQELFNRWFAELERENIPYVILHSYENFPDQIMSDVDYAVGHAHLPKISQLADRVAAECGWAVAQRLEHEPRVCWTVLVNQENPWQHLMLDVTSHYVRNRCCFLRDEDLLAGRRRFKGFFVPRPAAEFIYTVVKICAKAKTPAPYFDRLRQLHAEAPEECQQLFARLGGPEAGNAASWWEQPARDWRELRRLLHQRNRYTGKQYVALGQRIARRLRYPTGFTVAFLGPDGVGKSTVIQAVENWGRICFRRQMRIHFNPRFGPARETAPVTNPQGQIPRSMLMSILKVCFYFGRHLCHWLVKQAPARWAATLIIFDRTFVDLLVDPRRYRIRGGATLTRILARWLPRPDLFVILDGPASVVHRRKSELSEAEIERQREALLQLARKWPNAVVISADQPAEAVAHQAVVAILERMVARQKSLAGAK